MSEDYSNLTTARLLSAAANGSVDKVNAILDDGLPSTVKDYDNRTALHLATCEGHLDVVRLLVERNTPLNVEDRWGHTPLSDALKMGHDEIAAYLYAKGARLSCTGQELGRELTTAAYEGSLIKVKLLLEFGVDANSFDYNGRTALHFAASAGRTDIVKLLLDYDADVNLPDRWGSTPVSDAVQFKQFELAAMMRTACAKIADLESYKSSEQFVSALYRTIILLCEKGGWNYGTAWVIGKDDKVRTSEAWFAPTSDVCRLAEWRQLTEKTPLSIDNLSIIGRVIQTCQSEWLEELSPDNDHTLPGHVLQRTSFKSALALPIMINENLLAILEFRSFKITKMDPSISTYLETTASRMVVDQLRHFNSTVAVREAFDEQMNEVLRLVLSAGVFSEPVIRREVNWYYTSLGLHEFYWRQFSPHQISQHVMAFIASKLQGQTTGTSGVVRYCVEEPDSTLYIYPLEEALDVEREIESRWLAEGYRGSKSELSDHDLGISVKQFTSKGYSAPDCRQKIVIYFISESQFVREDEDVKNSYNIWEVGTGTFLREKSFDARRRYENALSKSLVENGLVININLPSRTTTSSLEELAVMTICYKLGSTHSFLSSTTLFFQLNGIKPVRKYVETFANGFIAYSIHFANVPKEKMKEITNLIPLTWILPRTTLSPMYELGKVALPVTQWAYCGWKFAYHFLSRSPEEWVALYEAFKHDVKTRVHLLKLKKQMHNELVTEHRISETIIQYPEIINEIYNDFRESFEPLTGANQGLNPSPKFNESLWMRINKSGFSLIDQEIFKALITFNSKILKTNFFKPTKNALSFRLEPSFLLDLDYAIVPYGVFLVIGAEFRGFHVRFDDVARGGIRLIKSRDKQIWQRNAEGLFDENYNLALTQTLKNKDIPESGGKGTIFLNVDHQDKDEVAFKKYIDSILDLLLPDPTIVDHFGKSEILFFGPDEGTAGFMDWTAQHARKRGYKFWSAVATGKSQFLGGIPHDHYAMTTRSIHQFVLGLVRKLEIKEQDLMEVQTGGPDGDLGSNEIKICSNRTKAVVDGSGVLYDPNGINRTELIRLANARQPVSFFNRDLLGRDGFLSLIDDINIELPNGDIVDNGMNLRNNFHLNPLAHADLFIPCGGRPASVNLANVDKIINGGPGGMPLYKYIVEGANLFLTQEARIKLEDAGIILFKDASTNKGGVTSSSFEVLASLCMNDEEFTRLMCVKDGVTPDFYQRYVGDIQQRIEANATDEFECLWLEGMKKNTNHCILTDHLSERINELNYQIRDSGMWDDKQLVNKVLGQVIPASLQQELTLEKVISRLPKSYLDAMLSSYLASRYVYTNGLSVNEFAFYQFMNGYRQ